jgi:hypothetical protein
MARHRTRVRLARSLRAVLLAAAASATATALFEWDLGRGLVLPLGLVALAPPVVYIALGLIVMREAPAGRGLGWAMAACGVNAAIGLATSAALSFAHPLSFESAITRAFGTFVPAPLIHLAAAPMVLLAFRSRVPATRPMVRKTPAASRTFGSAPAPNYDDVLRPPSMPVWATAPGQAVFEKARPREAEAKPVAEAKPTAVETASALVGAGASPHVVDLAPAPARQAAPKDTAVASDEPMLRVAFDRLASQLPPNVFVLPPGRLSESLREPHTLIVPQRLVVPQLGEGVVEIPWTLIEDQFPDLALAVPRSEVRRRFHDWVLSLPLDEVIGQIPPDLIRVAAPAADLPDIHEFPDPFTPGPPAPEPPPEPAPSASAPPPPPAPTVTPTAALPASPARVTPAGAAGAPAEPAPTGSAPAAATAPTRASAMPPPEAPAPAAAASSPAPATPATRTPAPAVSDERDEQLAALSHALAVMLAPAGALDGESRRVGGQPLVCFVAPALERAAVDALAARAAALLVRLAPWSVEQLTVRTSRVACVLVPLPSGGALTVGVRRGGSVALVELLAARARGVNPRLASVADVPPAMTPVPVDQAHARIGEATRALGVFGPVVPSEIAADRDGPGVYVFAAHAEPALVSAARAVHETLAARHDEGALGRLESVALRRGHERVIVRPLRLAAGATALLAAAGELTLTGRAQRAAARAATLLEAR